MSTFVGNAILILADFEIFTVPSCIWRGDPQQHALEYMRRGHDGPEARATEPDGPEAPGATGPDGPEAPEATEPDRPLLTVPYHLGYFIAVPYAAGRHTLVSLAMGDSLGGLPPVSAVVIDIYFASWRMGSGGTWARGT